MDNDRGQLATVATALAELTDRITRLAEALASAGDDQASTELFEVERALEQASRRLDRLVRGH